MIAPPTVVWTCIPSRSDGRRGVFRAGAVLTPYVVETIVEDARRAGRGARLRLDVIGDGGDRLALLLGHLTRLEGRGLRLDVRRRQPATAA